MGLETWDLFLLAFAVQIFNQHDLVVALVIDHLVYHVACDEDAEAAGPQALIFARSLVQHGVALGIEKGRDWARGLIERFYAEAFAGVFDAVENHARRAQVSDFDEL